MFCGNVLIGWLLSVSLGLLFIIEKDKKLWTPSCVLRVAFIYLLLRQRVLT